jgi:hypothetical protein
MDESEPPFPPNELSLLPASDWKPAVIDPPPAYSPADSPADLAKSDKIVAPARQRQSELWQNGLPNGPAVVVYDGNEEEVSRGFLIALRAMGVAGLEQPPEPAKPAGARAKP